MHPRTLFSYDKDNVIREGDTVLIYEKHDLAKQVVITPGAYYSAQKGVVKHEDIIQSGERYGTKIYTSNKRSCVTILRPTSDMYTRNLAQRTQILYTPDISQVLMRLELRPGVLVCESGTGSGSLSTSIVKAVMPTGHLYTFEFNETRVGRAKTDFKTLGFDPYVTVTHRDVLNEGFLLETTEENAGGVAEGKIDAVFLDLPRPHVAVAHAFQVLRKKGKLCNFSPCIEQVQKVSQEMARLGFYNIVTIECLSREIQTRRHMYTSLSKDTRPAESQKPEVKEEKEATKGEGIAQGRRNKKKEKDAKKVSKLVSMPQTEARGHTGYLTFAAKF